jgi:uncharacterized protein (TIGR02217 family)
MAFLEQRLDSKITHGAKSTVRWSRQKAYTGSGKLAQQFNWADAKHEMDVSHGVRSRTDYQTVLDFFYVVMAGAYEGFRVKDWRDFQATQTNSTLTFITGSTWQLQRKHTAGAVSYLRNIKKPVTGTVIVYRTRTAVVTTASATIDYTTGIATIAGHTSGDTYTWEGDFDIPMTFVNDEWTADLEVSTANLHMISQPILLEEIRL